MKKVILMLLLVTTSSCVYADWEIINKGSTATIYLDSSTRQRNFNKVKMWHLTDNYTIRPVNGGKAFLSL